MTKRVGNGDEYGGEEIYYVVQYNIEGKETVVSRVEIEVRSVQEQWLSTTSDILQHFPSSNKQAEGVKEMKQNMAKSPVGLAKTSAVNPVGETCSRKECQLARNWEPKKPIKPVKNSNNMRIPIGLIKEKTYAVSPVGETC